MDQSFRILQFGLIIIFVLAIAGSRSSPVDLHFENKILADPSCKSSDFQQITFHQSQNFSGNSQSFCSNQNDIQSIPGHARTAEHFCVDRGVWIIQFISRGVPSQTGILASGNIGRLCIRFPPESEMKYRSIRHLASVDLTRSVVSLYKESYRGDEFLVDANEIRLPNPVLVSSFALAGLDPMTIYSGIDFTGDVECLEPGANDPFYLGVAFYDEIRLKSVGSVRRGCLIKKLKQNLKSDTGVNKSGTVRVRAEPEVLKMMTIQNIQIF